MDFQEALDRAVGVAAAPWELELGGPHRWVGPAKGGVRRLVQFQMIGGSYSPRWGFGLDFVPAFSGGRLRWKRTVKSAAFDLAIDPIDESGVIPGWGWLHPGGLSGIERVVRDTMMRAGRDFGRVRSVGDVAALFAERAALKMVRFTLANYVQTDIAWGLSLLALGRTEEGDLMLGRYCSEHAVAAADPVLVKARAEALAMAAAG